MNFSRRSLFLLLVVQFGETLPSVLAFTTTTTTTAPSTTSTAFNIHQKHQSPSTLFVASAVRGTDDGTSTSKYDKDTAKNLPPFASKEEYLNYITEASALPKGFSTGSAVGSFVPEEAPSMGSLPIKATIIHLDEPTDSWAAVFTQNKVCIPFFVLYCHTEVLILPKLQLYQLMMILFFTACIHTTKTTYYSFLALQSKLDARGYHQVNQSKQS